MANNFIEEYHEKIWSGKITAGKWIKLWYEYVVSGLSEGRFFYDDAKAQKAIRYIETFCRHHEGALAPRLIVLELWQRHFCRLCLVSSMQTAFGSLRKLC